MCRIFTVVNLCCCAWIVLGWPAPLRAQEPTEAKLKKLAGDSRTRAAAIEVKFSVGERTGKAALHAEPIMKYTDIPRRIEMATLWVWQDEGRPIALGKVEAYQRKDAPAWLYCFASATDGLVNASWPDERSFQARKPGVEWNAIKGPAPDKTAAGQLRQLKEMFGRFTATSRDDMLKTKDELRPLARPLHVYSSPRHGVVQGVLCGFAANGTNPDVIVALEAVGEPGEKVEPKSWRYGVIRMTTNGVSVKLDNDEVFDRPYVNTSEDRDEWTHFWEDEPKK